MPLTFTVHNGTGWPPSSQATACINQVLADFSSYIDCNCNWDINFSWSDIGSGRIAQSSPVGGTSNNFATTKSMLTALRTNHDDFVKANAYPNLPGSDPSGGLTYFYRGAWGGIVTNTNWAGVFGSYDLIELNSNASITYDTDPTGQTCGVGKVGMYAATMHELTELAGRWSQLGNAPSAQVAPQDLFGFTGSGTPSFVGTAARYPSWDNGVTNPLAFFNTDASADFGGWGGSSSSLASMFNEVNASVYLHNPLIIQPLDMKLLAFTLPLTRKAQRIAGIGGSLGI